MDQSTAYLIMIFCPLIPWFLKLTISYRIRYKTPKLNVERFYKKNKSPFWKKYFYTDLKQRINPLIYSVNYIFGCLLIAFGFLSLIYMILAICRYNLSFLIIPQITVYVVLALTITLLIFGFLEILDDKKRK